MSATGSGGCGPGPGAASGPGAGASNPRKFSEKIALHTQRQAEETAAFQEVMMDITSTRLQAQKLRLARSQGPYFSGSLPNVNQIGRSPQDFQGGFPSSLESGRSTRHHGLVERVQRERRFISPVRPYRNRPMDSAPYSSAYLSPPSDPSWRRNCSGSFPGDKNQLFRLPTTALNRTNSDSALHTSVMNPHTGGGDPFSTGGRRPVFPYPVPPIEENVLDDGKLKPWDAKKLSLLSSRPKSCEVPGINVFSSPEPPSAAPLGVPLALNTGGSLPDLSSLHFPSPLPTPLDQDEPAFPAGPAPLSGGSSTGNLASTLTQLGLHTQGGGGAYQHHAPGVLTSLQSSLSGAPSMQSSLSQPNMQSSLCARSLSSSLHSSLSHPSLQSSSSSSLGSSPSMASSLSSSQSLHSSLSSSSSLQSASGGGYGGGQGSVPLGSVPQLSTSPRRRAQLSPLILPLGAEPRRHHTKQFSPTISPSLSSITQGVPLDTSKLSLDQRLPPYSLSQQSHQPIQGLQGALQQQHLQQLHRFQQQQQHTEPFPMQQQQQQQQQQQHLIKSEQVAIGTDQCLQGSSSCSTTSSTSSSSFSSSQCQLKQEVEVQHGSDGFPQLQQISHNLASDLYNDALFNSLLDDPYLSLQLGGKPSQPFLADHQGGVSDRSQLLPHSQTGLDLQDQQLLNNQNQNHGGGGGGGGGGDGRHNVPNIILTGGDSPPGLSKEITSALSNVPGFQLDPFSLDEPLRCMDPLALDLLDGELMLADPAVEDSFRSDRLK